MNSGAILNRINFGLGLAGGRFPGATLAQWSEAAQLKSSTREQQVDAVILAFFGGQASPDTRQILLRGENPLAATLGPHTENVEFDVYGEYRGINYGIVCSVRWQMSELIRHYRDKGVTGILCRGLDIQHHFEIQSAAKAHP